MQYYKMKYRLSMSHSATNQEADRHNHVIEVEITLRQMDSEFMEFGDIEEIMNQSMASYQNQYLNGMEEFHGDTSIENMGEVFFVRLLHAYREKKWELTRFEISENPLRVYAITKTKT